MAHTKFAWSPHDPIDSGPVGTKGLNNLENQYDDVMAVIATAKRTIVLTPGGAMPRTNSGCAYPATSQSSTNYNMLAYLAFASATKQYAQWQLVMPDNWDGGKITAQFIWSATGGTAGQNVIWGIQGIAYGDNATIDAAFGTAIEVTDSLQAANKVHISPVSGAVTIAGSPGGGRLVLLQVYQSASSNLSVASQLLGVRLSYGINAYSDD